MGGWFIFRQISAESGRVGRSDKGKKEARVGCLRLQKKFELHVINCHQNVAPSSWPSEVIRLKLTRAIDYANSIMIKVNSEKPHSK